MKTNIRLALFSFLLFVPLTQLLAADDKLPSVESFFQYDAVQNAAISPSGQHIAIAQRVTGGRFVIAIIDSVDPKKINVVGSADEGNIVLTVGWINDHRIYYSVYNPERSYQVDSVELDGSKFTTLFTPVSYATLRAFRLWGNTHDGSDDVITESFTFDNKTLLNTHLYKLNSRTGREVDWANTLQPKHVLSWLTDGNDYPRIANAKFQQRCSYWYLPEQSDSWVEINKQDCYEEKGFAPFFLESDHNLFVTQNLNGFRALYNYDLKSMTLADQPLVNIKGFDFNGYVQYDYVTKKVLGLHYTGDAKSTIWFDAGMKAAQQKIDQLLPATSNTIYCGANCSNSPALLVKGESDRQPPQFYIYSKSAGTIVGLGSSRPDIHPKQMGLRDFDHYAARDGLVIPAYVTLPPGKQTGPLPTVILVHGGPWLRGASWEWQADAQFLASRGYVVIQPEFRGSTGFGYAHFKAGFKQWGLTMQDDLADAAAWAIKKGWADPKRIAIMGGDYGGYATLMGLIKNPELFRCGVVWAAETDLTARFNSPEDDASNETLNFDLKTLIGDPDVDAAMFKQNSPLEHADKITQPLLMAHGGLDRRVPISHASAMVSAVRKHNDHVEWIVYNNEAHVVFHEENLIDLWNHIDVFLDKNLKAAR